MKVVSEKINLQEIKEMAGRLFENMVKGVVDIQKSLLALDAELHADLESLLLEQGSSQEDLWGINLYPELFGEDDFVEFDSMINVRPSQGNRTRGVDSEEIRRKILEIVQGKVTSS